MSNASIPQLVFRIHAIRRMFQRSISRDDIRQVIESGEVIEDYPNDYPFPSRLLLGWVGSRPIHVVAADNSLKRETIIITVYEPEPGKWSPDFRRRRS